jgi:hypothetical protein
MNQAMVEQADRVFTTEEHDRLVSYFETRNEQLLHTLRELDEDRKKHMALMDADHATYCAKLDDEHAKFAQRQARGWSRFNRLAGALTWFAWLMMWISGFAARGAWDRWTQ